METLEELRHECLSFVTVRGIGGSEREMYAVYQGGGESFSVAIMEGDETNPLRKGADDGQTFIVAGKSLALTPDPDSPLHSEIVGRRGGVL